MVVKGFTRIRHIKTEVGAFSDFLLATTPEEVTAFHNQNQQQKENSSRCPVYSDHSTADTNPTFTLTPVHHNLTSFNGQQQQQQQGVPSASYMNTGVQYKQEPVEFTNTTNYQLMTGQQQQPYHQQAMEIETASSAKSTPSKLQQSRKVPTISTGRRCLKDEKVNPDEALRRAKRRERNRLAAAKCRKKRQDQIEILSGEVSELENSNSNIESEVQELLNEKTRLLFFLQAHKMECQEPNNLRIPALPTVTLDIMTSSKSCTKSESMNMDETESCMSSSSTGLDSSFNAGCAGGTQRPTELPLSMSCSSNVMSGLNTPTFATNETPSSILLPSAEHLLSSNNGLSALASMTTVQLQQPQHNNNNNNSLSNLKLEPAPMVDYTNL